MLHLSRREREIVTLLIAGHSVKEAAAMLGLSARTAEGYLERLKRRFRMPRLLGLVVHLVKQGVGRMTMCRAVAYRGNTLLKVTARLQER